MKTNPLKSLTKFDWALYIISSIAIILCFLLPKEKDYLTLLSSLLGITSLVFISKGQVFGHIIGVIFAIFYGLVSLHFGYYGEFAIYFFMSAPLSFVSVITWLKNPAPLANEVKVGKLKLKDYVYMFILAISLGIGAYFALGAFGTKNLTVSAISVSTSFMGLFLSSMRSPYYAVAYLFNDVVLIALWAWASFSNNGYVHMLICFIVFFVYDAYGFISWKRMAKYQNKNKSKEKILDNEM